MTIRLKIVLLVLLSFAGCDSPERFPVCLGELKFSTLTISWDDGVFLNHKYQKYIEVHNPGDERVKLTCVGSIPELNKCKEFNVFLKSDTTLNWQRDSFVISPRSIDTLIIDFFPRDTNSLGYFRKEFIVEINDTVQYQHLLLEGQVQEYFEKSNNHQTPVIHVDNTVFDFGSIYEGEKAQHEFTVSNMGKSNLIIRKIETTCGCTTARLDKRVVKPGESVKLNLVFRSPGKQGKQNKIVTIYSNDPVGSIKEITVKGQILKR